MKNYAILLIIDTRKALINHCLVLLLDHLLPVQQTAVA